MKKRSFQILVALGALFLWGCYPDGPDYIEDMDVVITKHNPDYNYVAKSTYAIPDKVVKITGNLQEGDSPEYLPQSTVIISAIKKNMDALGWVEVNIADTATTHIDVFILPASWETTTIVYYYDYWYGWYGGYWGGYYPYYPYYGGGYYDSYSTGTLIWTLIDTDKDLISGTGSPVAQWTAALNGILTGSFSSTRVTKLIDKAFAQSPYLKTN
jgi:hypothetical protein